MDSLCTFGMDSSHGHDTSLSVLVLSCSIMFYHIPAVAGSKETSSPRNGFYTGPLHGHLDSLTVRAVRSWLMDLGELGMVWKGTVWMIDRHDFHGREIWKMSFYNILHHSISFYHFWRWLNQLLQDTSMNRGSQTMSVRGKSLEGEIVCGWNHRSI